MVIQSCTVLLIKKQMLMLLCLSAKASGITKIHLFFSYDQKFILVLLVAIHGSHRYDVDISSSFADFYKMYHWVLI